MFRSLAARAARTQTFASTLVLGPAALLVMAACVPIEPTGTGAVSPGGPTGPAGAAGQPAVAAQDEVKPPPAPPAAPEPPVKNTGNVYTDHFLELWTDIHKLSNGYFSPEGIPYHAVETLLVEAPDQGHETTSEAYSYWMWLEAMYGRVTKDWSHLDRAWANAEYYIIPSLADQPTIKGYSPRKAATYAPEGDLPQDYPVALDSRIPIGVDPIGEELKTTYGPAPIYGMHWLLDVDNFYGFGKRGDGKSRGAYINTFQRGPEESVWEAIPQPSWDAFAGGGPNGFLDIFQKGTGFAKQWKYTNAPDADARAVQAMYWAKKWADEQGGNTSVDANTAKAAKMGDYLRYSLFDKYFKVIPCKSPSCAAASDYSSAHYLLSWYYAWGGAAPGSGGWSWRIGSSHNHSGYQNPLAAHVLAQFDPLRPKSPKAAGDWATSAKRQIEFYRWLQSAEGGIAGGATNSWKGRYDAPPADAKTFYGMAYQSAPVFSDPPSNDWFGFQVWSVQRVAEYYYVTGDAGAKVILDKWVAWVKANTKLKPDGTYEIPSSLQWTGQPSLDWNDQTQNFNGSDKTFNAGLHVKVTSTTPDVGTTAGLVHTLTFYAAKANDKDTQKLAKELLDRMWAKFRDPKGLSNIETRKDYKRFNDALHLPTGWKGKMPNGDVIENGSTFASIRSKYKQDPDWAKVEAYLKGGPAPNFTYHRFWAQTHIALAYATYGWLFP
ncbi:glycoside hydrolase family 48 protein [Polyangium sorediatum]|uniref:Glycoside hydrolase family 48 protein n=1 Tax=Polyangium sorediatum TaxID=889274 RepID=A0ABT6P943_9BACT|nr:glycoside hydrolase family 48 protein [Polyangium sorediatum]MDI1437142.1 glycoside hydrolase family 48 protein [Polyangium sorediatum]